MSRVPKWKISKRQGGRPGSLLIGPYSDMLRRMIKAQIPKEEREWAPVLRAWVLKTDSAVSVAREIIYQVHRLNCPKCDGSGLMKLPDHLAEILGRSEWPCSCEPTVPDQVDETLRRATWLDERITDRDDRPEIIELVSPHIVDSDFATIVEGILS